MTTNSSSIRGRAGRLVAATALAAGGLAVADHAVDAQQATVSRPFMQLLCRFSDNPNTYNVTPATIDATYNGPTFSIDGYVREMSNGAANLAGTKVAGWFVLPKAKSGYAADFSGSAEMAQDCANAAMAGGTDLAPFRDIMVFVNDDLWAAGVAIPVTLTVGGNPTPYTAVVLQRRGLNSPPLALHELGHVFGGKHTRSATDPLGGGSHYGDRLDLPANFGTHRSTTIGPGWDASTRDAAGWIPADRKAVVTSGSQTVTLSRLTQPTATGSLLVNVPIGTTGSRYVVSARTRIGYDAQLQLANGSNQWGYVINAPGVVIELVSPTADTVTMFSEPGGQPESPASVWQAGQTFTDANGIRISIDRFDDTGAQVTVTNTGAAPVPTTTTTGPPPPTTTAPVATTAAPVATTAAPIATTAAAPVTTAAPAPTGGAPTDGLAAAPLLGLPTNVTLSTAGFGREVGESQPCAGIGATAWFKVTGPASGNLTVSTAGSSFDTAFAVYTGPPTGATFASLSGFGCLDDTPTPQAVFSGSVTPGSTIYVQVGGYAGTTGTLVLSVS